MAPLGIPMAAPCPNPLPLKLISGGDNKLGAFTTILAGEFGGVINLGLNCGKSSGGAFGEKAGAALFTFLGTIPALTSISAFHFSYLKYLLDTLPL